MIASDIANFMTALGLGPGDGVPWMPEPASTVAGHVDWLFNLILTITPYPLCNELE